MPARPIPFALRERLGDSGSAALLDVLAENRDEVMMLLADRFERRLGEECGTLREEIRALRVEFRSDLKVEVANVRADLLKWSFLFWVGQIAAVAGLAELIR
jgi:hypothetical protein